MNYLDAGKLVLQKLIDNGFQGYFVGGMVRDYLLNGVIHDIDITTSATPEDVMRIFPRNHPVGIRFGMVLVLIDEHEFEVTTFRTDLPYVDNRHPSDVLFSLSLEEDTKRRDFTINGMALDINMNLYDFHEGQKDLKNNIVRAIGNPLTRFSEDGLRILRAFYFVSKLGFDIEEETALAIEKSGHLLKNISIERIYQEVKKITEGAYQLKAFQLMKKYKISLFNLDSGINYLVEHNMRASIDELFVLSYKLNEEESDIWHLSNHDATLYRLALNLSMALEDGCYNSLHVYSNKKEACLLANRVNVIMGFTDASEKIEQIDRNLPIHKTCDLVFKGQDVMKLTPKEPAEWLGDLIDDIKYLVINGQLQNDYDEIKNYVINRFEKEGVPYEK